MSSNIIEMKQITKRFGTILANDKIDLIVRENSIHGILGENGAGKSTLMSILFGLYNPDGGEILIRNEVSNIKNPLDAEKKGIGMVHQHFKLVDTFDAIDNIILGNETRNKFGLVDRKSARIKIEEIAKKYHFDIDFKKPVGKLSVGQQQKIEILKTLYRDSNILIFDEPTAVLTPLEIEGFLKLLLDFKDSGKTIIIITHKLDEIKQVCDEATIIRHGKFVERIEVATTSTAHMSELMVGKHVEEIKNVVPVPIGNDILIIDNISVIEKGIVKLKNVSFQIKAGEIVAIAGVEGNGQSQLINAISGLNNHFSGEIKYAPLNSLHTDPLLSLKKLSIQKRYKIGISHIPEDRHKHGLILDEKLTNNMFLQSVSEKPFSFLGLLNTRAIKKNAEEIIKKFDVRGANNGDAFARSLSGGNQQKAIVGRELLRPHNLIIVAQPTRGLDVGAINDIHQYILQEKKLGRAVLLVSYELKEILALADRILVLNKGEIAGEILGKDATRKNVGMLMTGAREEDHE